LSISSQKYGVGIQDLRSGIRKKPIPDPVSRGQKGTVSHALSLPPPGIKPGSPASQAGTLPRELSRQLKPVLRIRDVYPRSRILIFSHPGPWIQNSNKREGWKKISCHNFLCSHKFHKIANYFSFEQLKKNIWANFHRIIELFNPNCQSRIQDPRSGIRKKPIPDPGSRGQKGTVSHIIYY
jgi:hypothetical protein